MWRYHGLLMRAGIGVLALMLAGCSSDLVRISPLQTASGTGVGYVAADEPQAVMAGRTILSQGGSAADAAVATAFTLSVTLQSSAGVGGGGLCLVYDARQRQSEMIDFTPVPAVGREDMARWQSAVPALPRGLFALHAKYGRLAWQTVVSPAETIARFEHTASRQLAEDLLKHSDTLVNDPNALDTFMSSRRTLVTEGEPITQLDLAATLAQLRGRTPSDFYSGITANQIDAQAAVAGLSITSSDLRDYTPEWSALAAVTLNGTNIYVAASAAMASDVLESVQSAEDREAFSTLNGEAGATGFVVKDEAGNAVACSLTMLRPFGAGVIPTGSGFLSAPSPEIAGAEAAPVIAAVGIDQRTGVPRFVIASGGADSGHRIAIEMARILSSNDRDARNSQATRGQRPYVNEIVCDGGAARRNSCSVFNDPAGFGYAVVAEEDR